MLLHSRHHQIITVHPWLILAYKYVVTHLYTRGTKKFSRYLSVPYMMQARLIHSDSITLTLSECLRETWKGLCCLVQYDKNNNNQWK